MIAAQVAAGLLVAGALVVIGVFLVLLLAGWWS